MYLIRKGDFMKIDRRCKTCEFNFNGICVGNEYDKRIVDENYVLVGGQLAWFTLMK